MSVGFRKSLLGFNCSDVMEYIEKSQNRFSKREKELTEKTDTLAAELKLNEESLNKLNAEKEQISKKLAEYNEKYEEIERLSENIGKLYLVAQANAQAITANSRKNAELAEGETAKNLSAIDTAHNSLEELKKQIKTTSEDFLSELDTLISSLNETRVTVASNTKASEAAKKQFDEIYTSMINPSK